MLSDILPEAMYQIAVNFKQETAITWKITEITYLLLFPQDYLYPIHRYHEIDLLFLNILNLEFIL